MEFWAFPLKGTGSQNTVFLLLALRATQAVYQPRQGDSFQGQGSAKPNEPRSSQLKLGGTERSDLIYFYTFQFPSGVWVVVGEQKNGGMEEK